MTSRKNYPHSVGILLDTINDIVELQKGKLTFSDTPHGKIHFHVRMYAFKWELRFAVTNIGDNRSQVQIDIEGDEPGKEELLRREFALLDSMLVAGEPVEIMKISDLRTEHSGEDKNKDENSE